MSEDSNTTGSYTFKKRPNGEAPPEYPAGVRMTRDEDRNIVQTFEALQDAVQASTFSTKENRDKWADIETMRESYRATAQWNGIEGGITAVRDAVANGWPDGVAKMRQALDDIGATLQPRNVRRVRRWADFGDTVEMSRVWAGRVDVAWQRCERQQRPAAQNVTIAANVTALRYVDAKDLFWRGAAVLKLSDMLTEAGYNVRIDAVRYSVNQFRDGSALLQRVTVKEPTAPLDLNSLASTLCLAGFFRVVLFQNACTGPKVNKGMGQSRYYISTTGELCGVERCMSAEAARSWINDALASIEGGPAQLAA